MKTRKTYSKEYKDEAIRLVKENARACIQMEKELGIGQATVSQWVREKDAS